MLQNESDDRPDWELFYDSVRAQWRSPRTLTGIVPVQDESVEKLQLRLENLNDKFSTRLAEVRDLHSFRISAVETDPSGEGSASVLINCVHDLPPRKHLQALTDCVGDLLAEAFGMCGRPCSSDDLTRLILKSRVREHTFFLGNIGHTVETIRREHQLRVAVQEYVDQGTAKGYWDNNYSSEEIRRKVRNHFLKIPPELPRTQQKKLSGQARWLKFLDLLATFLLFPFIGVLSKDIRVAIKRISDPMKRRITRLAFYAWWIYGSFPTAAGFLVSRYLELTEKESFAEPPNESLVRRLEVVENIGAKNAVTILFEVKDTRIRRWYLWMILRGAELGCRHFWTDGKLTGIGTIHYARIIQIQGGRRLLFMSDYDGSLNRYLDDFLGVGRRAVIPFTSNLTGCPRTRWLFGMHSKESFPARWNSMIRRYQVFTAVWYHAYPNMTVREIRNNAALRDELFSESLSPEEAERWTRRF